MTQNDSVDMEYTSIQCCPLCAGQHLSTLDSCNDTLVTEINRYLPENCPKLPSVINTRQRCGNCHHIFLSPRLNENSLKKIYQYWYNYAYNRIFDDNELIKSRLREFRCFHLRLLNKYRNKHQTILDIGCGSGLFLSVAAEKGWEVTGIEVDELAAKFGQDNFGIDIRVGTLKNGLNADDKFDVITMFDYLEHTPTPKEDIRIAREHLNPKGLLYIRVPNMTGFQSRYMKEEWLAVISNHLSYFSPTVLREHLTKNGFTIETIFARNYQNEFDIIKQRLKWALDKIHSRKKQKGKIHFVSDQIQSQQEVGVNNIKRLLYSLFIEQIDHVGGWFNKGNHLMVVARKNGEN